MKARELLKEILENAGDKNPKLLTVLNSYDITLKKHSLPKNSPEATELYVTLLRWGRDDKLSWWEKFQNEYGSQPDAESEGMLSLRDLESSRNKSSDPPSFDERHAFRFLRSVKQNLDNAKTCKKDYFKPLKESLSHTPPTKDTTLTTFKMKLPKFQEFKEKFVEETPGEATARAYYEYYLKRKAVMAVRQYREHKIHRRMMNKVADSLRIQSNKAKTAKALQESAKYLKENKQAREFYIRKCIYKMFQVWTQYTLLRIRNKISKQIARKYRQRKLITEWSQAVKAHIIKKGQNFTAGFIHDQWLLKKVFLALARQVNANMTLRILYKAARDRVNAGILRRYFTALHKYTLVKKEQKSIYFHAMKHEYRYKIKRGFHKFVRNVKAIRIENLVEMKAKLFYKTKMMPKIFNALIQGVKISLETKRLKLKAHAFYKETCRVWIISCMSKAAKISKESLTGIERRIVLNRKKVIMKNWKKVAQTKCYLRCMKENTTKLYHNNTKQRYFTAFKSAAAISLKNRTNNDKAVTFYKEISKFWVLSCLKQANSNLKARDEKVVSTFRRKKQRKVIRSWYAEISKPRRSYSPEVSLSRSFSHEVSFSTHRSYTPTYHRYQPKYIVTRDQKLAQYFKALRTACMLSKKYQIQKIEALEFRRDTCKYTVFSFLRQAARIFKTKEEIATVQVEQNRMKKLMSFWYIYTKERVLSRECINKAWSFYTSKVKAVVFSAMVQYYNFRKSKLQSIKNADIYSDFRIKRNIIHLIKQATLEQKQTHAQADLIYKKSSQRMIFNFLKIATSLLHSSQERAITNFAERRKVRILRSWSSVVKMLKPSPADSNLIHAAYSFLLCFQSPSDTDIIPSLFHIRRKDLYKKANETISTSLMRQVLTGWHSAILIERSQKEEEEILQETRLILLRKYFNILLYHYTLRQKCIAFQNLTAIRWGKRTFESFREACQMSKEKKLTMQLAYNHRVQYLMYKSLVAWRAWLQDHYEGHIQVEEDMVEAYAYYQHRLLRKAFLGWSNEVTDLSKNRHRALKYTVFSAWKLYARERSLLKKYLKESNLSDQYIMTSREIQQVSNLMTLRSISSAGSLLSQDAL
jgi:hypothetical protein